MVDLLVEEELLVDEDLALIRTNYYRTFSNF